MNEEYKVLPGVLGELVRAGFGEAALKLLDVHGGTLLYVPKTERSEVVRLIGTEAAEWLRNQYGGEQVLIPTAKRAFAAKPHILALRRRGLSIRRIALRTGVTVRWVSILCAQDCQARQRDALQGKLPL